MKITTSSVVEHPEGWHRFKAVSEEEAKGKYGTQIKWRMKSEVVNPDTEEHIELVYFTGTVLSTHEKCKLTHLFIACGILTAASQIDELGEDIDSAVILGRSFEGRVDAPTTEGGYANIGAVRPVKASRHKVTLSPKTGTEAGEDDPDDPFADE